MQDLVRLTDLVARRSKVPGAYFLLWAQQRFLTQAGLLPVPLDRLDDLGARSAGVTKVIVHFT